MKKLFSFVGDVTKKALRLNSVPKLLKVGGLSGLLILLPSFVYGQNNNNKDGKPTSMVPPGIVIEKDSTVTVTEVPCDCPPTEEKNKIPEDKSSNTLIYGGFGAGSTRIPGISTKGDDVVKTEPGGKPGGEKIDDGDGLIPNNNPPKLPETGKNELGKTKTYGQLNLGLIIDDLKKDKSIGGWIDMMLRTDGKELHPMLTAIIYQRYGTFAAGVGAKGGTDFLGRKLAPGVGIGKVFTGKSFDIVATGTSFYNLFKDSKRPFEVNAEIGAMTKMNYGRFVKAVEIAVQGQINAGKGLKPATDVSLNLRGFF